jgi:hypothetical protein
MFEPKRELGTTYVGSFSMAEYRFGIGDLVRVQIGILPKEGGALVEETFTLEETFKLFNGMYRVIRLVPVLVGDEPRYRIRGCYGQPERVVEQSFLTPIAAFPQPRE